MKTKLQRARLGLPAAVLLSLGAGSASATDWRIISLDGRPAEGDARIAFSPDGGVSGSTGCNRFMATGRIEAGALIISGPVAATKMACPGDALTAQDDAILALLNEDITFGFDPFSGEATMSGASGALRLSAAPSPRAPSVADEIPPTHAGRERPPGEPPYLNPYGLPGDLPIHGAPDAASEIVAGAFSGQVLRNLGCEGDWCRVETADGAAAGWAERRHLEASNSALRAGQGVFDAAGLLPCAQGAGAPTTRCVFGVARDGGGSATVVVTRPDGMQRAMFFTDGAFVGTDASEAGGGFDTSSTREGDLTRIRIDDERYEAPDAILFGG